MCSNRRPSPSHCLHARVPDESGPRCCGRRQSHRLARQQRSLRRPQPASSARARPPQPEPPQEIRFRRVELDSPATSVLLPACGDLHLLGGSDRQGHRSAAWGHCLFHQTLRCEPYRRTGSELRGALVNIRSARVDERPLSLRLPSPQGLRIFVKTNPLNSALS